MKVIHYLAVLLLLSLNGLLCAQPAEVAAEFASMVEADSQDGEAWFQMAMKARDAGETDTAKSALDKAAELQVSPIRIGVERSRILIYNNEREAAITELQKIFAAGFTAVSFFQNDPVINTLAGMPAYDALIGEMSVQAYPCENQERFREFDFWIGKWEVRGPNGSLQGQNDIRRAERGCVLLENWVSGNGGTGMSINYLDKATDEWVQVWVAEGGSQINIRGGLTDDGMQLVGTIHYISNGTTAPFRGLWTLLPDGRVRQFFEQSSDGGETWATWFEGFYSRAEED